MADVRIDDLTSVISAGSPCSHRQQVTSEEGAHVSIGRVIEGRYRVDSLLGEGGMGVVVRARDLRLARDVALKLLPAKTVGDAKARERLLREARAMAAFTHPNVAHVYDAGATDDGTTFVAMELIDGETVRKKLSTTWPLSDRVRALADAARALGSAHRKGLVHRDVKPDNLMVRSDGRVVLLDFGIVRLAPTTIAATEANALTEQDTIIGTLAYMSPEQSMGGELDGRSDQFSFGVTAFEVLTGEYPWSGASQAALLAALLTKPAPSASERGRVPVAVDAVLARAMEKQPSARYPSMDDLADALESACVGAIASLPAVPEVVRVASTSDAFAKTERATPSVTRPAEERPRSRWPARLAAVLGVPLVGIGIWMGVHARRTVAPATAPSEASVAASTSATGLSPTDLDELAAGTNHAEARTAFLIGLRAWHDGDGLRATREWERARTLDAAYGAPHLWLAAYAAQSDLILARKAFEQAWSNRSSLRGVNTTLVEAFAPWIQKEPRDKPATIAKLEAAIKQTPRSIVLWAWLAQLHFDTDWPSAVANDAIEKALALDPGLAQLLHMKGQGQAYFGRFDEAVTTLRQCEAIAPSASDCLADLMWIHLHRGDTEALVSLARRWQAVDAKSEWPYVLLGATARDRGESVEAMHELLAQAEARVSEIDRPLNALFYRAVESVARGDFVKANAVVADSAAVVGPTPDRSNHVVWKQFEIELARETGDLAKAGRIADDTLRRLESWLPDERAEDFAIAKDLEPYFLDVMVETGKMSKDERAKRRDAWMTAWRKRALPFYHGYLWLNAYAGLVRDEEGAREALATKPASGIPPFSPNTGPDEGLGQMFLLTGHPKEALPYLRRTFHSAYGVFYKWMNLRTAIPLGRALEETGDKEGACAAYRLVLERWGDAKPRSTTAEKAKRASLSLGCPK